MRLIIDNYGTYIHKKSNRFVIMHSENDREISADKVSQILIYRGAAITADAIDLAIKKGIDIIYLDRMGKPFARTYSCNLENSASIHRDQVRAYDTEASGMIMASIVEAKMKNQSFLLKSLAKNRSDEQLEDMAENIMALTQKITIMGNADETRARLMGLEGEAARQYYHALTHVLPEDAYHGKRTKQPPGDVFNALLSYGYGILFTEIERACIFSGLNPYMGFLHADRIGKPSLVLDLMEEFRQPIVDRSAITLVSKKIVHSDDITPVDGGYYLNSTGKHKLVEAIVSRFSKVITYRNYRHSYSSLILQQARGVVKFISGDTHEYSSFVYGW